MCPDFKRYSKILLCFCSFLSQLTLFGNFLVIGLCHVCITFNNLQEQILEPNQHRVSEAQYYILGQYIMHKNTIMLCTMSVQCHLKIVNEQSELLNHLK